MMSSISPDVRKQNGQGRAQVESCLVSRRKENRQGREKPVEMVHSVIYEGRKRTRQYKEGAVEWCIPEAVEWYIL